MLEGFLASVPPSPEWATFWGSLFEGVLSAFSVWLIAQIGITRTYAIQLICSLCIHLVLFLFAIFFAYQDGWPKMAIMECLGRTIVLSVFGAISHKYFYRQDRTRMYFHSPKC